MKCNQFLHFQGKFIRINFDASGYIAGANIGQYSVLNLPITVQYLRRVSLKTCKIFAIDTLNIEATSSVA